MACVKISLLYPKIFIYSKTCIQRPLKGSNGSGLLQQVVFKCSFYLVVLRRVVVSEQWSVKAGDLLIQVVSEYRFYCTVRISKRLELSI